MTCNPNVRALLEPILKSGEFSIEHAREIRKCDWRTMVTDLQGETKREAESLFYFAEGFVEEVDEGFVTDNTDPELYERTLRLAAKL